MEEFETVNIIRIDTGEAVKSVGDLRENVKAYKEILEGAEIGTKEYQDALNGLKVSQAALKDAMYATTASLDDVAASSQGLGNSYNALVKRMADLKAEFRATGDEARRAELGRQIKEVNDELKQMDAMQGNFQRNVGNYTNSIKEAARDMPQFADALKKPIDGIGKSMGLLQKNPLMGTIVLLVPIIQKIAAGLKENEKVMEAIKKAMAALQPIFDALSKVVEFLAEGLSRVIDWFVKLVGSSGDAFKNIIAGAVGVGNAILQYLLAPIRTVITAFKGLANIIKDVFTGNFKAIKEDAAAAWNGIKDAFTKGFDFKSNFEEGKRIGEQFVAGLGSGTKKAKEAGSSLGKSIAEGLEEAILQDIDRIQKEINDELDKMIASMDKAEQEAFKKANAAALAQLSAMEKTAKQRLQWNAINVEDERKRADEAYRITLESNEKRLAALKQFEADAWASGDIDAALDFWEQAADLEVEMEMNAAKEKARIRKQDLEDAKKNAESRMAILQSVASGTSSLLNGMAEAYISLSGDEAKATEQMKGLRIAAATIDMIAGAVAAYSTAQTLGPPAGPIIGAINAAAVVASGLANIAKIRNTQVNGGSTSTAAAITPKASSTPNISNNVPQTVPVIRGDSQDLLLRQMAQDQRVYILASDIEAKTAQRRVIVKEATF